jgi:hypothetical protein
VPNSERNPEKPAWLDQPPLPTAGAWQDTQPGGAQPGGFPPNGPWYDQTGQAPSMDPARGPLMPVVSPRGERRARFLGPLLALLLVALVVAAGAFAVRQIRDGNDDDPPPTTAANLTVPTGTAGAEGVTGSLATPESTPTEETAAEPTATAEPTEEPATEAPASADEGTPETESGDSGSARTINFKDATDFLPELSELPDGFVVSDSGGLSKTDVAEQIGGDGTATLNEWEWRENAYRYFDVPADQGPTDEDTISLTVSVHRFRLPAGAEAGLNGLADIVANTSGYEEVTDVPRIGDETRALTGETEDGNLYVLYVRTNNIVIRIGGFSVAGDSSDDVNALAEEIVTKMTS